MNKAEGEVVMSERAKTKPAWAGNAVSLPPPSRMSITSETWHMDVISSTTKQIPRGLFRNAEMQDTGALLSSLTQMRNVPKTL